MFKTLHFLNLLCFFLLLSGHRLKAQQKNNNSVPSSTETAVPGKYSYKVFQSDDTSYGFDILKDGEPFIHQRTLPALPGERGFESKAQAKEAAKLMLGKLEKGEFPPSLSEDEVKAILAKP